MTTAKGQWLNRHFDTVEKNLKSLEKEVASYVKASHLQYQKSIEFASTLELMETQEETKSLKQALKTVATSVKDVELHRQEVINVMETNILGQFGMFPGQIKEKKKATIERGKAFKSLEKVHKGWEKARNNKKGKAEIVAKKKRCVRKGLRFFHERGANIQRRYWIVRDYARAGS